MKINLLIFLVLIVSCDKNNSKTSKSIPKSKVEHSAKKQSSEEDGIINLNKEVVNILKNKNYQKLSPYIHPEKGIRFSMYSFVSDADKSFSKSEFEKFINSEMKFTFGHKDGSGAIFIVSLKDYLNNWVFKKDFSKAKINYEIFEGEGNSLNNIKEKYPNSVILENYLAGTVEYSYMDWNSMILVFEKIENQYYLIAIINNQWTV